MECTKVVVGLTYASVSDSLKEYLLLRTKDKNRWELPKGKVKKKETYEEAVRRELEEETHCANILDLRWLESQMKWKSYFVIFSAKIKRDEEIKIDRREHNRYRWASFEDTQKILNSPLDRRIVRNYNIALK